MIGTTADEFNYWKLYDEKMEKIIPAFLADQLFVMGLVLHNQREGEEEFLRYRAARGLEENRIAFANEVLFRIPAIKMAEIQSRFAETMDVTTSRGLRRFRAFSLPRPSNSPSCSHPQKPHCIEFTGGAPPRSLAERMQKTWVAFAASGNPDNSSIPAWDRYDITNRPTMVIHNEWRLENDPEGESRRITEWTYRVTD
jgi:para-nitrobenzyl esterase